jgi:hypothetical protein
LFAHVSVITTNLSTHTLFPVKKDKLLSIVFVTRSRIVANRARASIKKRHSDSESVRTNQKHAMRDCLESSGVIRTRASTAFRKSNRAPFFREIRSFYRERGGEKKKIKRFSAIPRDDANAKRTRVPARLQHFCDYFQTQHVVVHDEHPKVWDCGRGPAAHRFFTPKCKNF